MRNGFGPAADPAQNDPQLLVAHNFEALGDDLEQDDKDNHKNKRLRTRG